MVRKKRRSRRGGQPTGNRNHPRIKARNARGYHPGSQKFGAANEPSAMMKHDQPYNPPTPKFEEYVEPIHHGWVNVAAEEEEFERRGFVTDGSTTKKKENGGILVDGWEWEENGVKKEERVDDAEEGEVERKKLAPKHENL